jgi:hypothetical protein
MTDDRGGKPNPGTKKDKRLTTNKRDERPDWAAQVVAKSGPAEGMTDKLTGK